MKASEFISAIQELVKQHRDLQIGIVDSELGCFDPVFEMGIRQAVRKGFISDADELGDVFIFIR